MTGKSDAMMLAETNKAWSEAKIKGYEEDGTNGPEPIKRLYGLSVAVCNDPGVGLSAIVADDAVWQKATECTTPDQARIVLLKAIRMAGEIDEWKKAIGRDTPALAADMIAKLDAMAKASGETLSILREGALWFAQSAANLSRSTLGVELAQLAGSASGTYKAPPVVAASNPATVAVLPAEGRVEASSGPGVTFQDASEGRAAPVVATPAQAPAERKTIAFRRGLVLVKRDAPQHRVLFSNPKGPWIAQTITASGDLGPETAAHEGTYFADTWEEGPAYVAPAEPKKGEQMVVPGSGPIGDATPAVKPKTIADWNPDDAVINGFVKSFSERLNAAGTPMMVDAPLVRSIIQRFKNEKGTQENQKPGVSFFHYGMAALRG